MQNSNILPQIGFVRLPTVLQVYPISKSKLYADIKAGKFPAPLKLSERVSAWDVVTLRKFLESKGEV